ncbi:MAG: nuclear transport factor 2 family protein [Gemmatimonadales bacterium]|nr:nuclear transport factor 2 family protein [Gemmatimonadales bacterium]
MDTKQIGQRLVELCREGKNGEAHATLYSPEIVSVEAFAPPGMPAEMQGMEAIAQKGEWWTQNHEVHSATAKGPYTLGDRFSVIFNFDITPKTGPESGKRMQMEEVAVYTVQGGKIVREEFMY